MTQEDDDDSFRKMTETREYKLGYDLGVAMNSYEMGAQAQKAYDAGEIELWLDWQRPKSMEDWNTWEAEHGTSDELRARWADAD